MGIKYFSYFRFILNDFIINFNCYVIIMNEAFDERKLYSKSFYYP